MDLVYRRIAQEDAYVARLRSLEMDAIVEMDCREVIPRLMVLKRPLLECVPTSKLYAKCGACGNLQWVIPVADREF